MKAPMNSDEKMIVDAIIATRGRNGSPEWAKISDVNALLSKKCTPAEARSKIAALEKRGVIKRLNHCIAVREMRADPAEQHMVRNIARAKR